MRTFNERFANMFSELGNVEQLQIFNEYAYNVGEEPIEDMDCFDDLMSNWNPIDIALRIHFGDFNPNHLYFRFDSYGNLESTEFVHWWIEDYIDDLADYFEDRESDLENIVGADCWGLWDEEDEE